MKCPLFHNKKNIPITERESPLHTEISDALIKNPIHVILNGYFIRMRIFCKS